MYTKEKKMKDLYEWLNITPGKWKVVHLGKHWNNPSLDDYEIHYSDDGECICDTVYKKPDADIMAASKDMFKALIFGVQMIEAMPNFSEIDSCEYSFRNMAIDAIEKATGKKWQDISHYLKENH